MVIQNREDYAAEGKPWYKKVEDDLTTLHNSHVISQRELMRTHGKITQKVKDYLIADELCTT